MFTSLTCMVLLKIWNYHCMTALELWNKLGVKSPCRGLEHFRIWQLALGFIIGSISRSCVWSRILPLQWCIVPPFTIPVHIACIHLKCQIRLILVTLLQMGMGWSLLKPDALCLAYLNESGLSKSNQFDVFLRLSVYPESPAPINGSFLIL